MMKTYLLKIIGLATIGIAVSCNPNVYAPRPVSGQADFSQYIAVGNSLTAGFSDGGLYLEGQQAAFPNLLAEQMKAAGGGAFTSPFFDASQSNGSGYLRLKAIVDGYPVLENETTKLAFRDANKYLAKHLDPIQNLGVPGMRLDLAFYPPFSSLNNFFERLLPDEDVGTKDYFSYATAHEHTFFSFWLGNNDALGFATGGGHVTPENAGTTQLTDKDTFAALYANFINGLTEKGQKGIVATIPDVTAIPFFTTVTIAALLSEAKAAAPDRADEIQVIFIQDETAALPNLPNGVRVATNEDLIVLPFMSAGLLGKPNALGLPYGLHPANPIENQYILDKTEVARVKDYVSSYNSAIKTIAESKGLAVADVYTYLNQVNHGMLINGAEINGTFITGGAFSLDGVHLTPKGNALITNLFIREINKTYDANLTEVDVNRFRGVKFP